LKLKILDFCTLPEETYNKFWEDYMNYDRFEIIRVGTEPEEKIRELVKDVDIILSDPYHRVHVTTKIIEAAERLKLIQCYTTGFDDIDIKSAKAKGIPVSNNAGITGRPMAEYTLMAAMYLIKSIKYAHDQLSIGSWTALQLSTPPEIPLELGSQTFGIIGCGNIGQEIARLAKAFGCKIIYHNRNKLSDELESELNLQYASFYEILSKSDILSINVPLTDETREMIGTAEISRMKKGAVLINTSRGEIIDEHALADALSRGHLRGAAIDVYKNEPHLTDCPLIGFYNVILTPHSSAISPDIMIRAAVYTMENLNRVYEGKEPLRIVN
jgi:lactate dehydrogenase-like 2-hydroxyacid dehydrogenase